MTLRTIAAAAALAFVAAGAVAAAEGPQKEREEMMESVGRSMKALSDIAKGATAYDADVVRTSLSTISEVGKAFPDQFPAGSEGGEASPRIWESMDDFREKSAKLASDADTVLASMPADQAGVGAAIKTVGQNCGGCHEVYRIKK
ncbi:MAG: cytochrome c [Shinella sp.]|nr:cytochrome c [Shinella sp.]